MAAYETIRSIKSSAGPPARRLVRFTINTYCLIIKLGCKKTTQARLCELGAENERIKKELAVRGRNDDNQEEGRGRGRGLDNEEEEGEGEVENLGLGVPSTAQTCCAARSGILRVLWRIPRVSHVYWDT